MNHYERIADIVPRGELLAQLAEECAELGHAALKLRRALEGTNPTNVSAEEAEAKLIEEIADVYLCVDVVCAGRVRDGEVGIVREIMETLEYKRGRWENRLKEKPFKCEDACPIDGKADRKPAEQEPPRM